MPLLVYKSSAGSGKTFTLVKEYLKIVLLNPQSYRNILAITFTNKATTEMKGRITQTLAGLATQSSATSAMMQQLASDPELNLSPDAIALQSARVLQLILHGYSEFSVSTIDSFMHRVVRAFAFDLHLPVNFEVEIDTSVLIDRTVGELLNLIGSDTEITRLLTGFVKTLVDDEKGWDITGGLQAIAQTLFDERERRGAEPLKSLAPGDFIRLHLALQQTTLNFERALSELGRTFLLLMKSNGIEPVDTANGNAGFYLFMERLALGDFSKLTINQNIIKTLETEKWNSAKCSPQVLSALNTISGEIKQLLETTISRITADQQHYHTLVAVSENFFPMATLALLDQLLTGVARNRNLVHLSEFNRRIAGVVLSEPVPFIYARLGEKYRHFLIDEFQDTSIMQWQNLLPLVHNTLSSPDEGLEPVALVVGDSKQAIYRWRNGETEQFQKLPFIHNCPDTDWFKEAEQTLVNNFKHMDLAYNFRSAPEIVEFNNLLFARGETLLPEKFKGIYRQVDQKPGSHAQQGGISIHFYDGDREKERGKSWDMTMIKSTIETLVDKGFQYRQMAVLCRGNDDCATVARELTTDGIPVVSSESLLVASSPIVSAMISTLRMLHQPHNPVHCAALSQLLRTLKNTEEEAANTELNVLNAAGSDHLLALPLYDLAESVVRLLAFDRSGDVYLQFFLDGVQEFGRKDYRGLAGFLDWWDDQRTRRSIDLPEEANAVRIMTIHKSKGLAFDVVIVPFIGNTLKAGRAYEWITDVAVGDQKLPAARVRMTKKASETDYRQLYLDEIEKSLLDTLNLLYVAFTRAALRLYVFAAEPPAETDSHGAAFMLRSMLTLAWPPSAQSNHFTFGTDATTIKQPDRAEQPPQDEPAQGISFDWHDQIIVGRPSAAASRVAASSDSVEFGIQVHNLLSNILKPDDIAPQIEKAISNGLLDRETARRIETRIAEITNLPDISPFFNFSGAIRTEAPLLLPDGNILRPDRLLLTHQEAWVIDFKTGQPHPRHHEQVTKYVSALSDMGYPSVKGWLLYLSDPPHAEAVV